MKWQGATFPGPLGADWSVRSGRDQPSDALRARMIVFDEELVTH